VIEKKRRAGVRHHRPDPASARVLTVAFIERPALS
jgi:hypothetical protein